MPLSESFVKNSNDTLAATRWCLDNQKQIPALILIYSFIDSLAWATSDKKPNRTRENFEGWVCSWMLPTLKKKYPRLASVDLYAARCAALHTQTGNSKLSESGKAKRIVYAWGTGEVKELRLAIEVLGKKSLVELHFEDLFSALVSAIDGFMQAAESDPVLAARIEQAAEMHYGYISAE